MCYMFCFYMYSEKCSFECKNRAYNLSSNLQFKKNASKGSLNKQISNKIMKTNPEYSYTKRIDLI